MLESGSVGALERGPSIVDNARSVGTRGSVRRGYGEGSKPEAEANVRADPEALQAVLAAPSDSAITPLDTCDRVGLRGGKYQHVYRCGHPGIQAVLASYRVWKPTWPKQLPDTTKASTTLFDTVAVYPACWLVAS